MKLFKTYLIFLIVIFSVGCASNSKTAPQAMVKPQSPDSRIEGDFTADSAFAKNTSGHDPRPGA